MATNRHLEHLLGLVLAACRRGVETRLFLTSEGVLLTQEPRFAALAGQAQIAVCEVSFGTHGLFGEVPGVGYKDLAPRPAMPKCWKSATITWSFGRSAMKKVAVLLKEPHRQYEALRTSLGCLLEDHQVTCPVLDYEIARDEAFQDYLGFLSEMAGQHYSNNRENVALHEFTFATIEEMAARLRDMEIIIPF